MRPMREQLSHGDKDGLARCRYYRAVGGHIDMRRCEGALEAVTFGRCYGP
jgi:hypothetical protein